MELKHYLGIVWRWAWLIALSTLIAAGASYYTTSRQTRIYGAAAKLLVGQSIQSPDANSSDLYTSQQLALTYIQIARTTPVLQGAIDALGVNLSPDELNGMTSAVPIQGTQLIQLSVVDVDPARAQALANELAHQLTLQGPASTQQDQLKRREFVQREVDQLQTKIEQGRQTIADLQSSIQVTSSAGEIADKQQQINGLQAQIGQWQQSYASLLSLLAPRSPNYLSIIEPASRPCCPIGPNVMGNTLVAALIGLVLALTGALFIEYLDDKLKNPDDVSRVLGLSAVGSIARIGGGPENKLITAVVPRSPISEAYRVLRTNIQFSSVDRPVKSILVTSPAIGEGKSLMAANLAIVMAQAGLRTILVDADLRRPSMHGLFNVLNDAGLTDILVRQLPVGDYVRPTNVENLRVLTTGGLPPNPVEVLGSERMRAFKAQLEADADVVIFDSPPCLPVADAAVLARLVDGVLLVIDTARTHRETAVRGKQMLEKSGARMLGVVLNRISPRGSGYSYYYYYYALDGKHAAKQVRRQAEPGVRRPWRRLWTRR